MPATPAIFSTQTQHDRIKTSPTVVWTHPAGLLRFLDENVDSARRSINVNEKVPRISKQSYVIPTPFMQDQNLDCVTQNIFVPCTQPQTLLASTAAHVMFLTSNMYQLFCMTYIMQIILTSCIQEVHSKVVHNILHSSHALNPKHSLHLLYSDMLYM